MDRIDIAKLFDRSRSQLRDEIVGLVLRQSFWQQRFGPEIIDRLALDIVEGSLSALSKSIRYGAPMLFADQVRWHRDQLQAVGGSTGHVREICTDIWNVASAHLAESTLAAISAPIQSAFDGLSYAGVAQRLGVFHADLAEALVAATADAHWHWQAIYGPGGRDRALYEMWFFVDYVIDTLGSGKPDILRRELIWMRNDLTSRGLSTLHVRQLAWLLDQEVAARLPGEAAADLRHVMEVALPAIDDHNESCRALLGAQELIVAEVADHLTTAGLSPHSDQTPAEVGWYLAYLADSIAAGTPGPMCNYTRWMQHWLSDQGLPDTPLRYSYEVLYRAVGQHLPESASREAMAVIQAAQRLL
ncbi:MAG: hypothetical protein WCJ55_14555 [Chloroflexales bacterium]